MTDLATVPDLLGTSPADLIDPSAEQPASDRDTAVRRAERIRAGIAGYAAMRQDIADAYAQRDWQALDYGSWYEYVREEFGEELAALDRTDRREAVADLRSQGMSTRQIAAAVGTSQSDVARTLKQVSQSDSPDAGPEPAAVNGSDGKSYPAARPFTGRVVPPDPQPGPAPVVRFETAEEERARVETERQRRLSAGFGADLVRLASVLDPDPWQFYLRTWDPDANPHRGLPNAADFFTPRGLRHVAELLSQLADHLEDEGRDLL